MKVDSYLTVNEPLLAAASLRFQADMHSAGYARRNGPKGFIRAYSCKDSEDMFEVAQQAVNLCRKHYLQSIRCHIASGAEEIIIEVKLKGGEG